MEKWYFSLETVPTWLPPVNRRYWKLSPAHEKSFRHAIDARSKQAWKGLHRKLVISGECVWVWLIISARWKILTGTGSNRKLLAGEIFLKNLLVGSWNFLCAGLDEQSRDSSVEFIGLSYYHIRLNSYKKFRSTSLQAISIWSRDYWAPFSSKEEVKNDLAFGKGNRSNWVYNCWTAKLFAVIMRSSRMFLVRL